MARRQSRAIPRELRSVARRCERLSNHRLARPSRRATAIRCQCQSRQLPRRGRHASRMPRARRRRWSVPLLVRDLRQPPRRDVKCRRGPDSASSRVLARPSAMRLIPRRGQARATGEGAGRSNRWRCCLERAVRQSSMRMASMQRDRPPHVPSRCLLPRRTPPARRFRLPTRVHAYRRCHERCHGRPR